MVLFPVLLYKYWMARRNNQGLYRLLMKPGLLLTNSFYHLTSRRWAALNQLNISVRFPVVCVCKSENLWCSQQIETTASSSRSYTLTSERGIFCLGPNTLLASKVCSYELQASVTEGSDVFLQAGRSPSPFLYTQIKMSSHSNNLLYGFSLMDVVYLRGLELLLPLPCSQRPL